MGIYKGKIKYFISFTLLFAAIFLFSFGNSYAKENSVPNIPIIESFEPSKDEDNALVLKINPNNNGNDYYIHVYSPTMERGDNFTASNYPLVYRNLPEGEEQSVMVRACVKENDNDYKCSEYSKTAVAIPMSLPEDNNNDFYVTNAEVDKECPKSQEYNSETKQCELSIEEIEPAKNCPFGTEWDGEDCVIENSEKQDLQDTSTSSIAKIQLTHTRLKYNGTNRTPAVKVYNSSNVLIPEKNANNTKNYEVSYPKNRKNIGEYTVKVTAGDKVLSKNFKIFPVATKITDVKADKNSATVSLKKPEKQDDGVIYKIVYKKSIDSEKEWGNNFVTTSSLSANIDELEEGTEYEFKVIAFKKVDNKTYKSGYSKVVKQKTTGTSKKIKAVLAYTKTTYTGTQKTPQVTVYGYDGTKLTLNKDYKVSHPKAIHIGEYTVTVTPINNYSGTKNKELNFTIVPSNGSISSAETFENSIKLNFKEPNHDPGELQYQVQYRKKGETVWNKSRKTQVIKKTKAPGSSPSSNKRIPSINIGGFSSNTKYEFRLRTCYNDYCNDYTKTTKTFSTTSSNNLTNITSSNIKITVTHPNDNSIYYHYTGNPKKPSVVSLKETGTNETLKLGVDYKATYKNNVEVGVAKLTLTGIGNYTGTKIYSYVIKPEKPIISASEKKNSITINVKSPKGDTKNIRYIYYYKEKGAKEYTKSSGTASTSKTYTGLKKNKVYYFKVQAYTVNYSNSPTKASDVKSVKYGNDNKKDNQRNEVEWF